MSVLLSKWHELKLKIKELEKQESEIRTKVETFMNTKQLDTFRSHNFRVTKRVMSRETLSKKSCPPEVWSKYSQKHQYTVIRLDNIGEEHTELDN